MIELVTITPSDQGPSTTLYNLQKNIEVSIVNSAGEQQLCELLSNYNLYTEVPCKKVGNQIIVKRPGSDMTLAMAGASILSNCDCAQSSLNPALIFDAKPLASSTTISTTSTGAPVSITLNKQMADTVSRVCGNADGFTKCGPRTLVFTDKMTGFQITFPYKGYELNSDQSNLTLNPAKAPPTSVLIVSVKLDNYPSVTFSQDITAVVEQPVAVQPLRISNKALNATINQETFLELPQLDAQYTYVVVNKQKFEASVDGNKLKVLSKNETDVGTYYLNLIAKSSSQNVSFQVKIILALPTQSETKTTSSQVQNQAVSNSTQVQ